MVRSTLRWAGVARGGVYRIVYDGHNHPALNVARAVADEDQPLAAWSRSRLARSSSGNNSQTYLDRLMRGAADKSLPAQKRIRALTIIQLLHLPVPRQFVHELTVDVNPEIRALGVVMVGLIEGHDDVDRDRLLNALNDDDALVRRRACEALVRTGLEPPIDALWPLLADRDRFVRTAARLVLQRIESPHWIERLWNETSDTIFLEGVVALCKMNQAAGASAPILQRLEKVADTELAAAKLDFLRVLQLVFIHAAPRDSSAQVLAQRCYQQFPQPDWRVNRELAILATHCRTSELLNKPVHEKLLNALLESSSNRQQQIHYFYCLRLLANEPWTAEQKRALVDWYDSTKGWQGGHSFTPFLENIFREILAAYTVGERRELLKHAEQQPLVALVLAQRLQTDRQKELLLDLEQLAQRIGNSFKPYRGTDLPQAVGTAVLRTAMRFPSAESWPYLVAGLDTANAVVLFDLVDILKKMPNRPTADQPAMFRALLTASNRLDERSRWKSVELLRHWTSGKTFGSEDGDWKQELAAWRKWYAQTFPKEPALAGEASEPTAPSKYTFDELLRLLESATGRQGDVSKGRIVFEKGQCIKCHKFGRDGEGIGPDLTTLSKRFKRSDILESLIYPSKVISDQYRSTSIVTKKGQQINGLAAVQGETVTVLQSDGTKVMLTKDEIAQQFASLVSVMPEKLLDPLTKEEIVDLFRFLESEPSN